MQSIRHLLGDAALIAGSRLVSAIIDTLLALFPVAILWATVSQLFGNIAASWAFFAVSTPVLLAFFESSRMGQTPGKFVFGLRASEIASTQHRLSFYSSLKRHFPLYLGMNALFLLTEIMDKWFEIPKSNLTAFPVLAWVFLLMAYSFIRTGGRMGLHDLIANTKVDWINSDWSEIATERLRKEVLIIVCVIVTLHIGFLSSVKMRMEDVRQDIEKRQLQEMVHYAETEMPPFSYRTSEIGNGIENLFDYYDDLHGYIGSVSFGALERSIGITRKGIAVPHKDSDAIPVFQVFVTAKGLISPRFQERISESLIQLARETGKVDAILVEFVYRGSVLEIVYPLVIRRMFVYSLRVGNGATAYQTIMVSPEYSGMLTLGGSKLPDFMIGMKSINDLRSK